MVEQLFLVERTDRPDNDVRDGIKTVIINNDDADTDAQIITAAILAVNTALPVDADAEAKIPAGYFDTVSPLTPLSAGPLATDLDILVHKAEVASTRT